jgi:general secretion pathway protein E
MCNRSGYLGRIGIYEIISLNEKLRGMIREGTSTDEVIREARNGDLITMREDGVLKAIK